MGISVGPDGATADATADAFGNDTSPDDVIGEEPIALGDSGDGGGPGDGGHLTDSGNGEQESGASEAGIEAGREAGPDAGCTVASLPTTSAAFKSTVAACVYAESCFNGCVDFTMSDCISQSYLSSVSALQCQASITSCAQYQACTGINIPNTTQCPTSNSTARCSGTLAINCGADSNLLNGIQDCSVTGGTCNTYLDPAGLNAKAAGCELPNATTPYSCTNTDGLLHCGTHNELYTCVNGKEYGQLCGTEATCFNDAVCAPKGTACTANGTYTCASASTATWCEDNATYSLDCGNLGFGCKVDSASSKADCVAPGCSTTDYNNCTEACVSTTKANLCIGGVPYEIDCTNYGFNSCADSSNGGVCSYVYCSY
jgi:hypothetical protein